MEDPNSTIVSGICLQNLPLDITVNQLTSELLRIFPEELTEPAKNRKLQIKVFLPKNGNKRAVVSGFVGNFEKMKNNSRNSFILSQEVNIKKDIGDERDAVGDFIFKNAPAQNRSLGILHGITNRKVLQVFRKRFLQDINVKILNNGNKRTLYLNTCNYNPDLIKQAGRLEFQGSNVKNNFVRIRYVTVLENIQAIRYLNNNKELSSPPSQFTDKTGEHQSACSAIKGIGINGQLWKINEEGNAVVPFKDLDECIIDLTAIDKGMESFCWRCESAFQLVGVNLDLNYVTGICKCDYKCNTEILDAKRAYHWPTEEFTRLCLGQKNADNSFPMIISHVPMRMSYESADHYREIVLPILQEEWNYSSLEFRRNYATEGKLQSMEIVEILNEPRGAKKVIYAIQVTTKKTKFWTAENLAAVRNVTIHMEVLKQTVFKQTYKGKVRGLTNEDDEHVRVFLNIGLEKNAIPYYPQNLDIIPKPSKSEYSSNKQIIQKWAKGESDKYPLLDILLNQEVLSKKTNWKLDPQAIKLKRVCLPTPLKLQFMHENLNEEQKRALQIAKTHSISFIHGPPGTGKTFCGAAIIITLSVKEQGRILVCAPSNVAADGIAQSIDNLSSHYSLKTSVLRIFSKTRENQYSNTASYGKKSSEPKHTYKLLHEEVRKSKKWMNEDEIQDIVKKVNAGEEFLLTENERLKLDLHIQKLEIEVMKEFDIFVSTVGALSDKRVERWNNDCDITTIVLDEAGQLTQPATIATLILKPRRFVAIGDHLQLKPTVLSYAAQIAGLDRSMMEWLTLNSAHNKDLPWTTLLEQHRMDPKIRQIVSSLTYNNTLRDAPMILERNLNIPQEIFQTFPQLKKTSVLVFDHKHPETYTDPSYKNEGEAVKVVDVIRQLLNSKITAQQIAVLTFYEAQKQTITAKLKEASELNSKDITVANVDGFQGRERDIVILSLVRSNQKAALGFTSVANRVNVSLSRAKAFLILICNYDTFKSHKNQVWKKLSMEINKTALFLR